MKPGHRGPPPPRREGPPIAVLFDPSKPDKELFDGLAEQQADMLEINSSQLRRFFGEIKDLYRQFNAQVAGEAEESKKEQVYKQRIEPRFKMVRSKVAYASRPGGQAKVSAEFARFLQDGIKKVADHKQFVRFVMHLEAVVGFMYGKGKVRQ